MKRKGTYIVFRPREFRLIVHDNKLHKGNYISYCKYCSACLDRYKIFIKSYLLYMSIRAVLHDAHILKQTLNTRVSK